MTVDELLARESIRHTLATYNMSGDRVDAETLAGCFTEDGILEPDWRASGEGIRHVGRAVIRAFFQQFREPPKGAPTPTPGQKRFVRHNLTTCQIEITGPETATARTYWIVYTQAGPDNSGYYSDQFRKVGDRWLIAYRRSRVDWMSPTSALFRADVHK